MDWVRVAGRSVHCPAVSNEACSTAWSEGEPNYVQKNKNKKLEKYSVLLLSRHNCYKQMIMYKTGLSTTSAKPNRTVCVSAPS